MTRTSLSALTSDDYTLRDSGGAWQLTDATTGQSVALTGAGSAASPFTAAGISIVVSGTPAAGDSFLIQPTAAATAGLAVALTDPSQIAAASLAQTGVGANNTGTGTISAATVNPATWVPDTYTISFTATNQYQITSSAGTVVAAATYSAGTPISFQGAEVTISGTPASGDSFTVRSSTAADAGDNTNANALISALGASSLGGGTTSLSGAANNLIARVGIITQQAQSNAAAQQSVNQDATTARSNLTGVNLDEQASKMLQYQQAYQAMAQMIQTSGEMFTSLITAIGNG